MRTTKLALVVLSLVAATLAGCGGGGGDGGAGSGAGTGTGTGTGTDTGSSGGSGSASPGDAAASSPQGTLSVSLFTSTGTVGAGSSVDVAVVVDNASANAVTGAVLTLDFDSALVAGTPTCTPGNGATCPTADLSKAAVTLGTIAPQQQLVFHVPAAVPASAHGLYQARVNLGGNVQATANVVAPITVVSADISVAAAAVAASVPAGGQTSYVTTVANAGPDTATNVVVASALDQGQIMGTPTCVAAGGAICPATLGATTTIASLPVNGSITLSVPSTVPSAARGPVNDVVSVSSLGDPQPANNAAVATVSAYDPTAGAQTKVTLQSDAGDYIGGGGTYAYDQTNALLTFNATGNHLSVAVGGNESWTGDFALPAGFTQLTPGTYANLTRYLGLGAAGAMNWDGQGRGCNTLTGALTINSVTYVSGQLSTIDLSFVRHCEGGAPALHGTVHWVAADTSGPAGPLVPAPTNLWAPAAGATPATGNYIYLQSDAGDFIGAGGTYTYTQANAVLGVTTSGGHLGVSVAGDQQWAGDFQTMRSVATLQRGYYANLQRYPFQNTVFGGLSWNGEGRGCNTSIGWFVVDNVSYNEATLTALDARFQQNCEGGRPALHGAIHWVAGDPTTPTGPVTPVPSTLWSAPSNLVPSSGSYLILQSDAGDYIGQGATAVYTAAAFPMTLATNTNVNGFTFAVNGGSTWMGLFDGIRTQAQMAPGYYAGLERVISMNPTKGGLDFFGSGRGCNTLTGWIAIDGITYVGNSIAAVDARFEQHCEGGTPALHGQVHWVGP